MKKILQGIFIMILSLPILFIGSTILYYTLPPTYDPKTVTLVEEKVISYLMENKGYHREDLISYKTVKIAKGFRGNDYNPEAYEVSITFTDEPEANYYYSIDNDEKVRQRGYGGNALKHIEEEDY